MRNNNITIAQDMNRIFDLKGESTSELLDYITPTIEIKRFCNICRNNLLNNSTSVTIYTTPADKDFYMTSAQLAWIKDVTSTAITMGMTIVIESSTRYVFEIPGISLTPDVGCVSNSFYIPIKCDRNTNIELISNTNVANVRIMGTIQGYTVETTKGV